MEILGTQQFNEGIRIKPVTRERMMSSPLKTVKIGNLVWTAENCDWIRTNFGRDLEKGDEYIVDNGIHYYTHDAAQLIVPKGFRLPTKHDFMELFDQCDKLVKTFCQRNAEEKTYLDSTQS